MITEHNIALGLVTPGNSQEFTDDYDVHEERSDITIIHSFNNQIIHNVDWIDTDASEDEDYLPQNQHTLIPSPPCRKRSRSNSQQTEDEYNNESPGQRVRRAIDVAVDTGVDFVDLRYLTDMSVTMYIET